MRKKSLIIADSSTLILLTKAKILDKIISEFDITIPNKVYEEAVIKGKELQKEDAFIIEIKIKDRKIKVEQRVKKNKKIENLLKSVNLGAGEKDCILLYVQLIADLLLVDDKQAIKIAKILQWQWSTSVNMLIDLANNNKIGYDEAMEALESLQKHGRYRLDYINETRKILEKIFKR